MCFISILLVFFLGAGLGGGESIKKRETDEGIPCKQMNELKKRQVSDGQKSILLIFPAPSEKVQEKIIC